MIKSLIDEYLDLYNSILISNNIYNIYIDNFNSMITINYLNITFRKKKIQLLLIKLDIIW